MAELVKHSEEVAPTCMESVNRFSKLPVVSSGIQTATSLYSKVRDYNSITQWTMSTAESTVSKAMEIGRPIAVPIIQKLDGPIKKVDGALCTGLDYVEEKVPAVKLPPAEIFSQMYTTTKDFVNNTVTPTVETAYNTAHTIVDPALKTAKHYVDPAMHAAMKMVDPAMHHAKSVHDASMLAAKNVYESSAVQAAKNHPAVQAAVHAVEPAVKEAYKIVEPVVQPALDKAHEWKESAMKKVEEVLHHSEVTDEESETFNMNGHSDNHSNHNHQD